MQKYNLAFSLKHVSDNTQKHGSEKNNHASPKLAFKPCCLQIVALLPLCFEGAPRTNPQHNTPRVLASCKHKPTRILAQLEQTG